jgi:hypothetical protein
MSYRELHSTASSLYFLRSSILVVILFTWLQGQAQYISEVIEYKPAPGQLINTFPWGGPSSAQSITGGVNGSLCLGAFGGYVVFRFEEPVANHPDNPFGIDFTIFGNAAAEWSEPGVVSVMKDENGNGLADDTWFELAGSDHGFSTTVNDYRVTYQNPQDASADVPWFDIEGRTGFIFKNSAYLQPYYPLPDSFPAIDQVEYTLGGTRVMQAIDSLQAITKSYRRAFGYADNTIRGLPPYTMPDNPYTVQVENSGGDGFDISWAVNLEGDYVDLDEVHFVKVQSAVMDNGGVLGEISTEITGAVDVSPDPSVSGEMRAIVIRDIPPLIYTGNYQLEVFAFEDGRYNPGADIAWNSSMTEAIVNENDVLVTSETGELTLTAYLVDDPSVSSSVTFRVVQSSGTADAGISRATYSVYPNPAEGHIRIKGLEESSVTITDLSGKTVRLVEKCSEQDLIDLTPIPPGLYLVRIIGPAGTCTLKFLRR